MKALLIVLAFLSLSTPARACANFSGSGTGFNGAWTSGRSPYVVMELRRALARNLEKDGAQMEAALRDSTNFNDRSDYSVALMYLGRSKEAVDLLQALEKEKPGEYFVAANLGTAYELSGNNEEAVRWITEGIRRNPQSHEGTEWLHVKILEAKIAQQKDPDYFKKHSVLNLTPQEINDETVIGPQKLAPRQTLAAIAHQLTERVQFVKPPDPAVASLLFDYAAIEAKTGTLESARQVLDMATSYGYPPDRVNPLMKLYNHRIAMRKAGQYSLVGFIAFAALALLYLLYKKGIFVISSRDLRRPA